MPASGSCIFTDIDEYKASLEEMVELLVVPSRGFRAQLTRVKLGALRLTRVDEALSRVAYIALPQGVAAISFSLQPDSPLIYDGAELRFGDIIFHDWDQHLHQRTTGTSRWGSIWLPAASLTNSSWTLLGSDVVSTSRGRVMRPRPKDRQKLLRIHGEACRIVETRLPRIEHPEVARALGQDLVWALVTCLSDSKPQEDLTVTGLAPGLMARFEAALVRGGERLLEIPDICVTLGISETALQNCCSEALGMSPSRYLRLRRLNLARVALLQADPAEHDSAQVIGKFGFRDLSLFLSEYRQCFGESPFRTVHHRAG